MRSFMVFAFVLVAQTSGAAASQACSCAADFDTLAAKVVADYPRYHLEHVDRDVRYRALVDSLRAAARTAGDDECVSVLRALVDYFHDPHLFIMESPSVADSVRDRLRREAEVIPLDEAGIREALRRRTDTLDPVEGIWYTEAFRVGVIRDPRRRRDFVAVYLGGSDSGWAAGQVKAELWRSEGGGYRGIVYAADHTRRHEPGGRIYRGTLLQLFGETWGKQYPVPDAEAGVLDTLDPLRPTVRFLGEGATVISVPSHAYPYRAVLDSLLERHRVELARRDLLIVDLRGDAGGSSLMTWGLRPYYETADRRPPIGPQGRSVVLSSPDNISYFQRQSWVQKDLVERLEAAPGRLVPLSTKPSTPPAAPDTVYARPRHFAIVADGGVLSAGEAFILFALRSTRVTLFGSPTGGAIDYQNVGIVWLACRGERGLLLGYPTIAATATLPKDGLNPTGIRPDVPIGPEIDDPLAFVVGYFAGRETPPAR